ncbi:hypothetical protein GCM10023189_01090 [Nibrella saemangeumensis]|uniref:Uncharacterized protein n=1 Tax=Nibrella saemangeumensis TaxID=1084526 RepID=A0ABP8M9L6_9BACT
MNTTAPYKSIEPGFYEEIKAVAAQRKLVRMEYLTDLHEYIRADALLKRMYAEGDAEFIELASGATIRLDSIVSIDGKLSPDYPGYENFACSL